MLNSVLSQVTSFGAAAVYTKFFDGKNKIGAIPLFASVGVLVLLWAQAFGLLLWLAKPEIWPRSHRFGRASQLRRATSSTTRGTTPSACSYSNATSGTGERSVRM
jgi:hypothetical protein